MEEEFKRWLKWWVESKNWSSLSYREKLESKRSAWAAWKEAWEQSQSMLEDQHLIQESSRGAINGGCMAIDLDCPVNCNPSKCLRYVPPPVHS